MQKVFKILKRYFLFSSLVFIVGFLGIIASSALSNNFFIKVDYSEVGFKTVEIRDPFLLKDFEYFNLGVKGKTYFLQQFIYFNNVNKILLNSKSFENKPLTNFVFKGGLSNIELQSYLNQKLNTYLQQFNEEQFKNITIESLLLKDEKSKSISLNEFFIADLEVFMGNCNFYNNLNIYYNIFKKEYKFYNIDEFTSNLCKRYTEPADAVFLDCTKCEYFPVDKKHPLKSDYSVKIINAEGIPGGQRLKPETYSNLLELYKNAKASGFNMHLTSGFRSYSDQQKVFESWVNYEMSFGKSREVAESAANTYSAKPGESEHQLGTVADIIAIECVGFDRYCQPNIDLWQWLENNAYKFGFVKSYPKGFEEKTGYVNEQWHYRYIGIELATEFYTKYNGKSFLTEFLRNKKLY